MTKDELQAHIDEKYPNLGMRVLSDSLHPNDISTEISFQAHWYLNKQEGKGLIKARILGALVDMKEFTEHHIDTIKGEIG